MKDSTPEAPGAPGLADNSQQLVRLIDSIRDCAIYMIDPAGTVISWNAGAERIKGYTAQEILGRNFGEFYTPEDRHAGVPARVLNTAEQTGKFEGEGWRVKKDGTKFWASVLIDALRSPGGELLGFAKITRDMTDRQRMQEQLNQSQKMEAVGQLTGGVAHDFNNLLTVILGNLDSLSQELPAEQVRWRQRVDHALRAAERAAGLTQQLLAFARRQPLRPKPIEINRLLARWTELIRRTMPENLYIRRIESDVAEAVAEVDANQLENALLNLVVNARDAMPTGGTLTIETATTQLTQQDVRLVPDLSPGKYVVIYITDTGAGMTQEVLDRAFDPFFTTKPLGQGTGLGLSQVFGFVKQSGGHIKIYSRPGQGTTIKIYLRQIENETMPPLSSSAEPVRSARTETILVVEDNDAVRSFASDALREFGFNVIEASDAAEALKILDRNSQVELLFTDIGLPGLNGRELAATVQRRYPMVRLLFTSGYAQMPSPTPTSSMMDIPLLSKPFTRSQLYERVTQLLDASVPRSE